MTGRKVIRLHRTLEDGGHWFCCGSGEAFVQQASEIVDDAALTKLLPLVETYARERITERLVQAASYFDGYTETTEIALGGQRYVVTKLHEMVADPSELYPCNCPDRHCGDCGCCTCLTCGHTPENHDPDDGCGACAMAMRPFRHDYDART